MLQTRCTCNVVLGSLDAVSLNIGHKMKQTSSKCDFFEKKNKQTNSKIQWVYLNTKRRYKSVLRDSAHQSKTPMRRFHWSEINGLTFSLEMESVFVVFQRIFVS